MLNSEQSAHVAYLAKLSADEKCGCGWNDRRTCQLACTHPQQRPEDRAIMEAYRQGRQVERERTDRQVKRMLASYGAALPEGDPRRQAGRSALSLLLASLRGTAWSVAALAGLLAFSAPSQAREPWKPHTANIYGKDGSKVGSYTETSPGKRTYYKADGSRAGRSESDRNGTRFYNSDGSKAGSTRRR